MIRTEQIENLRKLERWLAVSFRGAQFGDVRVDAVLIALRAVIELLAIRDAIDLEHGDTSPVVEGTEYKFVANLNDESFERELARHALEDWSVQEWHVLMPNEGTMARHWAILVRTTRVAETT